MQIKHIALAALATIAATQAQAVTRITGASASSIGYVEALSNTGVCTNNDVSVFVRGTSSVTNALGNNFTVKCNSGNFSGTTDNEVQIDVSGGSLNAIMFSDAVAAADASSPLVNNGNFLPSTTTGCTGVAGTGALSFLNGTKLKVCASNAALTAGKSIGGFMDLEPQIFQAQGVVAGDYSGSVSPAVFSQAFAVGVSSALYQALQADQGLTVGATDVANQPTVGRAQIAAIIDNNDFNGAKNNGAKFLVSSANAGSQTNLTYCRRPATSGTQMGAEVYFLQAVLGTGNLAGAGSIHEPSYLTGAAPSGVTTVVNGGSVQAGNVSVQLNSGTGDVKKCLNRASVNSQAVTSGTFAIGLLSAENNPVGTTDSYRLVKINGASTTGGTSTDSQTTNAIKGTYDYVFESVVFNPHNNAVLNLINTNVKTGSGTPGVFLNINSATPESQFTRNGSSVNVYTSN